MKKTILFFLIAFFLFSCRQKKEPEIDSEPQSIDYDSMANVIARETIIVDGHVDLSYRLLQHREDVTQLSQYGNFDYPRAKRGGLNAPFVSIYVPVAYENRNAKFFAANQIEGIKQLTRRHPEHFAMAYSPEAIRDQFTKGLISFPLGIENGAPIEGDLANVQFFYELGVRYITLCHFKDNHICDAATDNSHTWGGLSPFGKELVAEMNRVGMMIDISHASDQSISDILNVTTKPVIASHSSCRYFTPGFSRNLPDNLIKRIGENGGIVMVNFGSYFLNPEGKKAFLEIDRWRRRQGFSMYAPEVLKYAEKYHEGHPSFGSAKDIVDHIDHVIDVAGIDHVGFGSDYDGIGWVLPEGMRYVDGYPLMIAEMLKRGYDLEMIEKVCYKNIFRVWEEQ